MSNFAITQDDLLDTVNYIISGPVSIGQEVEGVGEANSVYFTDNIAPYSVPVSAGAPSPAPTANAYIKTDCFGTCTIFTPDQKIQVGGQLRPFISFTITTAPAAFRFYTAIIRFTDPDLVVYEDPAGGYGTPQGSGVELAYTIVRVDESSTGVFSVFPIGSQQISTYIDQPGLEDYLNYDPVNQVYIPTVGNYTYWLMFRVEPVTGTFTIDSVQADVRSLTASLLKS